MNNITPHPYHIRYINNCNSEWVALNNSFPDPPLPPNLCDVILGESIRLNDVYVEKNSNTLHIYKKIHLVAYPEINFFRNWISKEVEEKERFYLGYMGYDQIASIFTSNVIILKKSV